MYLRHQFSDYGDVLEVLLDLTFNGELRVLSVRENVADVPPDDIPAAIIRCKGRLLDMLVSVARPDSHVAVVRTKPIDADALASRKTV